MGNIGPFKVEEGLIENNKGEYIKEYYITEDDIPMYQVNSFLYMKGMVKKTTSRAYAYSLVKFLKFLGDKNINYNNCTIYTVKQYIMFLILGPMEDLKIIDSNSITYSTLKLDISVINEFYKYLKDELIDINIDTKISKRDRKKSYLYGQITDFNYEKIIDQYALKLKENKRYLKWYSTNERQAIEDNLKTYRDKAVFLLTLEGMRIDEVLSLEMDQINEEDKTVRPSRSKGKSDSEKCDEDEIRFVALPNYTYEVLNNYILTERMDAENESGIYSNNVFINIKKGEEQGHVLKYHNFLKILKRAANNAGINNSRIRTHSGRSTKVNDLLEFQCKYPEENLSDLNIQAIMGWKNLTSINSYKNHDNEFIAKSVRDKATRRTKG